MYLGLLSVRYAAVTWAFIGIHRTTSRRTQDEAGGVLRGSIAQLSLFDHFLYTTRNFQITARPPQLLLSIFQLNMRIIDLDTFAQLVINVATAPEMSETSSCILKVLLLQTSLRKSRNFPGLCQWDRDATPHVCLLWSIFRRCTHGPWCSRKTAENRRGYSACVSTEYIIAFCNTKHKKHFKVEETVHLKSSDHFGEGCHIL